jgi:hypothetical protein
MKNTPKIIAGLFICYVLNLLIYSTYQRVQLIEDSKSAWSDPETRAKLETVVGSLEEWIELVTCDDKIGNPVFQIGYVIGFPIYIISPLVALLLVVFIPRVLSRKKNP